MKMEHMNFLEDLEANYLSLKSLILKHEKSINEMGEATDELFELERLLHNVLCRNDMGSRGQRMDGKTLVPKYRRL